MLRNAKIGDRVQVIDNNGNPATNGRSSARNYDRVLTADWDYAKVNTGTVVEIDRSYSRLRWVVVRPNPPGFGEFHFRAQNLRRIRKNRS